MLHGGGGICLEREVCGYLEGGLSRQREQQAQRPSQETLFGMFKKEHFSPSLSFFFFFHPRFQFISNI